jgi:hypothetical protein
MFVPPSIGELAGTAGPRAGAIRRRPVAGRHRIGTGYSNWIESMTCWMA